MKKNASILLFQTLLSTVLFFVTVLSFGQTPHIDSLKLFIQTAQEDTLKANALIELTRAYLFELNDYSSLNASNNRQLELSQKLNFKKGIAYGASFKGTWYWKKGNYVMALDEYKKALVLMKECGQKKGESSCYLNIGLVYSEQGDQMKAIEYMLKGIKIKTELNDKKGIRIGYNNIGNIYSTMGNYKEGLNYYFKTLKLAEELNDQLAISYAYDNIGTIFYHQNKLDVALIYYKKAVKIQEDTGEKLIKGNSYNSIGNIYQIKKQYKEALEYHVRDLKIKEVANDKQGIATACYHIGLDYYGTKNFEKALSYQRMSFAICNEIGYKKGIAEATGGIGKIYEEKKDYSKALIHYNQMLSISNELSFKEGIRDAYSNLASVSIKLKQFEKALKYVELHNEIKDTLLNKENFKQINELNTRYETDKKEKEILLLTKDKELNAKIIRQQQLVRWGLIGGLGLLSVSVFSIYRRYRFKQKANVILEKQKEEIQQKNMLITDSIDYAQTIQQAVLPTQEDINQLIPHSFILYKPKAVVSGDFYWIGQVKERLVCAVADCTGHGVPGAFMSLLGYNMLENAVKNPMITTPAIILDTLNTEINLRLAGNNRAEESKHGMDISLITINKKTNSLEFAGAHNSIYIVRKNELIELKADKMGIGGNKQTNRTFTNQITEIQTGDMIYLFTDGFPDQIGGPNRKKFYYQPFKELLVSISSLEMKQQQIRLNDAHSKWMGDRMDQTDDILIMGIRYS